MKGRNWLGDRTFFSKTWKEAFFDCSPGYPEPGGWIPSLLASSLRQGVYLYGVYSCWRAGVLSGGSLAVLPAAWKGMGFLVYLVGNFPANVTQSGERACFLGSPAWVPSISHPRWMLFEISAPETVCMSSKGRAGALRQKAKDLRWATPHARVLLPKAAPCMHAAPARGVRLEGWLNSTLLP